MPSKSSVAIARLARSALAKKMLQDLQLAGFSERTQETYLRAVYKLAEYTRTSPDRITEAQVRDYLLMLRNVKAVCTRTIDSLR